MPDAKIGYGTTFKRSDNGTSGGVMSAIANIRSVQPPGYSRETKDVTHLESPNRFREFISGLRDGGEFSADFYLDASDTAYTTLLADLADDDPGYYEIELVSGSKWGCTAFITNIGAPTFDENESIVSATFKVTGEPVWTPAV